MQLTLPQVAKLFDVSENTVAGWVRDENLPAEFVNSQYRFHGSEILEWSALKQKNCSPKVFQQVNGDRLGKLSLADALECGGVLHAVPSDSKEAAFRAAVATMPLPDGFEREFLLELLLARESLSSTGVGDGVAIPHPRYPVVLPVPNPLVRLCYLSQPVDFQSSDLKPVDKLFVMICPTVHCHLQLLAILARALCDEQVRALLAARAERQQLVEAIRQAERLLHLSDQADVTRTTRCLRSATLTTSVMPHRLNSQPMPLAEVPVLSWIAFTENFATEIGNGAVLSAFFGRPMTAHAARLYAVFSRTATGTIAVFSTDVGERYPSLTVECPQAHWFEREIAEQWGIVPEHHPWLKPIRFHASYRHGHDAWDRNPNEPILPCVTDYFRVEGDEVHEVAVGPVHAGVIEPGHFRFQCHGERVFHLEIELGFQHRGVERNLTGGPNKRSIHYAETLAGDTSIGHATAYCQAVEALGGMEPPLRSQSIRAISLEFERLANHTGDLGALANDVGYLPTASYCGRLRGEFLNASATVCGSRFGRGLVRPGGVLFDIESSRAEELSSKIESALRDVGGAARLLWQTASVLTRFDETGRLTSEVCDELGLVGLAARACGTDRDIRRDFPSGYFRFAQIPVATWYSGDVFARAYVRWLEIQRSCRFIREQLASLPRGELRRKVGDLRPNSLVVSLVEGWRGEICHVAMTDDAGRFAHYKIVDPSFHNWIGLAMSLRGQQISDFPLCNKSFNLSYCGHDL